MFNAEFVMMFGVDFRVVIGLLIISLVFPFYYDSIISTFVLLTVTYIVLQLIYAVLKKLYNRIKTSKK